MFVIGHRGARGEAPENTLPGFLHARAAGACHFELDVRLSWDERAVVVHDATVDRTTDESGEIAEFPASHLASLDARRNTAGWHCPVGIPTLEEVLIACSDTESWQLEIKHDHPGRIKPLLHEMAAIIDRLHIADRVTLTSLDIAVLELARTEVPLLARGYVAETGIPEPVATALQLDCELLVCNWQLVDAKLVADAHAAGLPVSVWTVNDMLVVERMRNAGVDSLITDFPTAMLAHLKMRNALATGSAP